jgi:beta-lactamase regulating signal transducer with metallopeptidase domain
MNTLQLFCESLPLQLVQALLHFLWQGCAVALVVLLAGTTLKRASAHIRYLFYVAAMLVMVVCLPVTFALLDVARQGASELPSPTGASAPGTNNRVGPVAPSATAGVLAGTPNRTAAAKPPAWRDVAEWVASRGNRLLSWLTPFAPFVTAAYFLGVALMAVRLTVALHGGRRLRQSAIPVDDNCLLAMLERQVRRMRVKAAPAIAYCERISIPIVVGIVKPAILLPAALASGLAPDQLQAILAHELAHIRRFDLLVNLLQRLAEAVLFFHPAVWFVSRRISIEREIATDDMVLAAGWPRFHYADALVRMAELASSLRNTQFVEQGAAVAAWGSRESEFKRRVLRLVAGDDRPIVRLTGAGCTLFVAILILVALTPLFVQAWASTPATVELTPPASSRAPDPPAPDAKHNEPHIIIAEHVLSWDNQIVTWDQVVARLRTMRESGPFRGHFYFTNGLSAKKDGWKDYDDRIMKLYPEIFEPVGISIGSVSPKGSARWDAIRTADDLRPDPKRMRSGQVVTPQGERARDAQVIILPTAGPFATSTVMLSGTQLRDPSDEQWSTTDENGHFIVYPADDSDLLAILHPSGFVIQAGTAKNVVFRLQPWATITFSSTGDVADQQANISITPTGAKPGQAGFAIYSIETKGKPVEVKVPAGEIVVSRSLEMEKGRSVTTPVEEFSLRPGKARTFELKPPTEADRKRSRDLYEQMHGRRQKSQ